MNKIKKIKRIKRIKRIKKEIFLIFLIILFGLNLIGCVGDYKDTKNGIVSPSNKSITVEGFYKISEVISLEEDKFIDERNYKNFSAEFSVDEARVGMETVINPKYKIKKVSTYDFFSKEYMLSKDNLKIDNETMFVTSINDKEKSFYDIYQLSDEDIMIVKGSNLLKLKKIHNENLINKLRADQSEISSSIDIEPKAGVLIGLRGKRNKDSLERTYRTLWITSDGEFQELYEIPDILFPRKEFFKLRVKNKKEGKESLDTIEIDPVTKNSKSNDKSIYSKETKFIDIDFVGNNYIGIGIDNDKNNNSLFKKIVSIDDIYNLEGTNIESFYGEDGIEEFDAALKNEIEKENILKEINLDESRVYNSFYIKRNNGNWMIKDRIMIKKDSKLKKEYIDIPIALRPPRELVSYDDLNINWSEIVEKVPQAKDAFLAPKNSFILIRTPKYLMMYKLKGLNKLEDFPTKIIEIKEEEEIIMAEWAGGDFVERWTETVKTIGQKIIFVQNIR